MRRIVQKWRLTITQQHWWRKSKLLKPFARSLYWNLPRSLRDSKLTQKAIESIARKTPVNFIQIGANDGIHSDPIYHYVKSHKWKGLMIEPNPHMLQLLKKNHAQSNSLLEFENVAIGDQGNFTLYWCSEDPGMASIDKSHVIKHIGNNKWTINETKVIMIAFKDLIQRHQKFQSVNLLLIDTEGWDGKIINSINFSTFKTDLLIFEKSHLDIETYNEVKYNLQKANYSLGECGWDCIAISNNTTNKHLKKVLSNIDTF